MEQYLNEGVSEDSLQEIANELNVDLRGVTQIPGNSILQNPHKYAPLLLNPRKY